MSRPILSPINTAFERRRGQVERQRSMEGKVHRVVGFIETSGSGEGLVDVLFPVSFIQRPSVSFGGELGANEVLEDGNFPTVNAMVKSWNTVDRASHTYYVGATLVVVLTGAVRQVATVHWQAEGRALVNPLLTPGGADDTI